MATINIAYTPDANFDHGTLYAKRMDNNTVSSQAALSGVNSVTVVEGIQYAFWIEKYNSLDEFYGIYGPLFTTIPYSESGADFGIRWTTDYDTEWYNATFDSAETRIRIPSNRRGHWMQWEIYGDAQNQRFEMDDVGMTMRLHGESYGARQ